MTRRPSGTGTFFQRADGRWEGRVPTRSVTGNLIYKRVIRKSQTAAYAAWEDLKRQ